MRQGQVCWKRLFSNKPVLLICKNIVLVDVRGHSLRDCYLKRIKYYKWQQANRPVVWSYIPRSTLFTGTSFSAVQYAINTSSVMWMRRYTEKFNTKCQRSLAPGGCSLASPISAHWTEVRLILLRMSLQPRVLCLKQAYNLTVVTDRLLSRWNQFKELQWNRNSCIRDRTSSYGYQNRVCRLYTVVIYLWEAFSYWMIIYWKPC